MPKIDKNTWEEGFSWSENGRCSECGHYCGNSSNCRWCDE